MTQTFEEYLDDSEFEKIKCEKCGNPPSYTLWGTSFFCEICMKKDYEENKK